MNSFLLVLCSLAVVFSANIDFAPRGISIRAPRSLAQTLTGSRHMKRHFEHEESDHHHGEHEESDGAHHHDCEDEEHDEAHHHQGEHEESNGAHHHHGEHEKSDGAHHHHIEHEEGNEPHHHCEHEESDDGHHHHGAQPLKKRQAEAVSATMSALQTFLTSLKASLETVQKSSSPQKSASQDELAAFFSGLLQSKTTLQTAMANVPQVPGGPSKAEVAQFFTLSTENIVKLKQSLVNSDKKPEAVNTYFTRLGESVASLQASLQGKTDPIMLKFDVSTFFVTLAEKTKKLEVALSK